MTRFTYLPLVVLIVCLPCIAGAEMYQWVDDKGVKHYANSPPPEGVKAKSSWDEVQTGAVDAQDRKTREAAIIKETEAANRQAEIDTAAARKQKASQAALDAKKAELKALGESIASKRRYVKRRGKTDINKLKRLDEEIAALKKDPSADPAKIKSLEEEAEKTRQKFYGKSGRGRKGTKEEVVRYRQLELEIEAMEKELSKTKK